MTLQIGLNLITMALCIVTLTMAMAALMPHLKQALVVMRDGLLWMTLLVVVGGVATVGWGRFFKVYAQQHKKTQSASSHRESEQPLPVGERIAPQPMVSKASITRRALDQPHPQAFKPNRSRPIDASHQR